MRKKNSNTPPLGLDFLVDIVSNSVGILIILTVFMALISLVDPLEPIPEKKEENLLLQKKVVIPWTHYSQKSSILFLIRDNHLLYFDRALVYEKLAEELKYTNQPETNFTFPEYSVDLLIYSTYWHCLDFKPQPQAGEWWHQPKTLRALATDHSPSEFYFFFWVDSNSFEMFREVRAVLQENKFEVGWKPIVDQSPLRYCSGANRFLSFQPQ